MDNCTPIENMFKMILKKYFYVEDKK